MGNLLSLLMIVLFVVALISQVIFAGDGMQSDANEMKTNTQEIITEANSQMTSFSTTP